MTNYKSEPPGKDEYHPFYEGYVSLAASSGERDAGDAVEILRRQTDATLSLVREFSEERAGESYSPGKWSVKELLGHVCDSERVFAYRALCIARGDAQSLPGMDQELYVPHAKFNARTLESLAEEFKHLRAATISLLENLDEEAWRRRGVANESPVTVRALAHIIAGHVAHHANVLRERYKPALAP